MVGAEVLMGMGVFLCLVGFGVVLGIFVVYVFD